MGLLKSVIADARPAKNAGRSADAIASVSGQPLHNSKIDSSSVNSVPDPLAQPMGVSDESKQFSMSNMDSALKNEMPSVSNQMQDAGKRYVPDSGKNKPSESGRAVLQNSRSPDLIREPGNDSFDYTKRIYQPLVDPVHETASAPQTAFTRINENIETIKHLQSHSGNDQQEDSEQALKHDPNEVSMPNGTGEGTIPDDKSVTSDRRDHNHDSLEDHIPDSVAPAKTSDRFRNGITAFEAEKKPQSTISENHLSSGNNKGHTVKQAVTEVPSSTKPHTALRQEDPQPAVPRVTLRSDAAHRNNEMPETIGEMNISENKSDQQLPMDQVSSDQQPPIVPSPVSVKPVKEELKKVSTAVEKQEPAASIEKRTGRVEARSTRVIDDPMKGHHVNEPGDVRTPGIEVPRPAEVKIGRIDVFVEKLSRDVSSGNRATATRPSVSLASRHYLRRL